MPDEGFEDNAPQPPSGFGPVKSHLSAGREDHERGWREHAEIAGGGQVPPLRSDLVLSKEPLAERFRARIAEGPTRGKKGR
jgi:hypothetical protein